MKTSKQLLELVKAGLWSDYTPSANLFDPQTDWESIYTLAKAQTVTGIAYDGIEKLPHDIRPPRATFLAWFAYVNRIAQTNLIINAKVKEIFNLYTTNSLRPVLLKGASIASQYPIPLRRECGDIDILLTPDEAIIADKLLSEKYGVAPHKEGDEGDKHSLFIVDGVVVENHCEMCSFDSQSLRKEFNDRLHRWFVDEPLYRHQFINGVGVAAVPEAFNTQFLYIHLMRHFIGGGVGLRQLCDLAIALSRAGLSEKSVFVPKKSYQIIERTLVRHLGLEPQCAIYNNSKLNKKSDKVIEYIIAEGNFGIEAKRTIFNGDKSDSTKGRIRLSISRVRRYISLYTIFPHEVMSSLSNSIPRGARLIIKSLRGDQ